MAINFQYNASEYEEKSFQLIPEGEHRVRISEVVEATSQTGKQMLKLTLDVSGYSSSLWYYLVFDPANSKMTNQKIGDLFASFGITNPNINAYQGWVGKIGACRVKHEDYKGDKQAYVWYFTNKKSQEKLPAWKEPARQNQQQATYQQNQHVPPAPMYQAAPQYQPGYQAPTPVPPSDNWVPTQEQMPF